MTNNEEDIKLNQNIYRVCCNILVLLDVGLFPGKHALGLEEGKGFIASLAADAKAKSEPKIVPPVMMPPAPSMAPT